MRNDMKFGTLNLYGIVMIVSNTGVSIIKIGWLKLILTIWPQYVSCRPFWEVIFHLLKAVWGFDFWHTVSQCSNHYLAIKIFEKGSFVQVLLGLKVFGDFGIFGISDPAPCITPPLKIPKRFLLFLTHFLKGRQCALPNHC